MGAESEEIRAAIVEGFKTEYKNWSFINEGGTAWVYGGEKTSIEQTRILKLLKVDLGNISVPLADGKVVSRNFHALFLQEIRKVLAISHPNVIKLYDAGALKTGARDLPWYIMEYLPGADDLDKYLEKQLQQGLTETRLISVLRSAAEGLSALHASRIAHLDVKPQNILVGKNDQVRVADLGFAKSLDDLSGEGKETHTLVVADRRFMAPRLVKLLEEQKAIYEKAGKDVRTTAVAIPREALKEVAFLLDLVSLGKTLTFLLDSLPLTPILSPGTMEYLRRTARRLEDADSDAKLKYLSSTELCEDLAKLGKNYSILGLAPELNLVLPSAIRLAGEIDTPKTSRLVPIIDNGVLQRLRAVRQLSLTHWVYPGATHTRFEHSLGVLSMTARYTMALWHSTHSQAFRNVVKSEDIGALLVAALLHDIGHYPMAHAFEEVEPRNLVFFKHDYITQRLLLGQDPQPRINWDRAKLIEALEKGWNVEVEDVAAILRGAGPTKKVRPELLTMLHSILDGPIDADKADYLIRDSVHTGNPYGSAIDLAKLLQNIAAFQGSAAIGVQEKGLRSVERLYLNRYHMFVTVYWHHTKRAAERMITEAIRLVHERLKPEAFQSWFYDKAFESNDEQLLDVIGRELDNAGLARDLVEPLRASGCRREDLYRRLVEITSEDTAAELRTAHEYIVEFFDQYMTGSEDGLLRYRYFEGRLRADILKRAGGRFLAHHVLLDVPDPRAAKAVHLKVRDNKGEEHDASRRSSIFAHFVTDWRLHARKVRLFVHRGLRPVLKDREKEVLQAVHELAVEVKSLARIEKEDVKRIWSELPR